MGKFEDLVSYLDKAKISPGTYIMNTEESISAVSICVNCSQSNCPNDSASFSFATDPRHPLMWSHYTGDGSGFAIGYDVTKLSKLSGGEVRLQKLSISCEIFCAHCF